MSVKLIDEVYLCLVRCKWLVYGPSNDTVAVSLASLKSRMVYLSSSGLLVPRLSWKVLLLLAVVCLVCQFNSQLVGW